MGWSSTAQRAAAPASGRRLLGGLLCVGLVAAGTLNLVPGAHPDGAGHRAEVGAHVRERATWFVRRDSNDLAELALVHGRTIRVRYAPYLQIGAQLHPRRLITYPASLAGEDHPRAGAAGDVPDRVLQRQRIVGLTRAEVVVEDYDPRLTAGQAAELERRAVHEGQLQSGNRLVIVGGTGSGGGAARVLVHDDVVYVVDEVAAQTSGHPAGRPTGGAT